MQRQATKQEKRKSCNNVLDILPVEQWYQHHQHQQQQQQLEEEEEEKEEEEAVWVDVSVFTRTNAASSNVVVSE